MRNINQESQCTGLCLKWGPREYKIRVYKRLVHCLYRLDLSGRLAYRSASVAHLTQTVLKFHFKSSQTDFWCSVCTSELEVDLLRQDIQLYCQYVGWYQWPGLQVWIPPGAWMSVSFECCVLSGWGLCVGLVTSPEIVLRSVVFLCVIVKPRHWGGPGKYGLWCHERKQVQSMTVLLKM